MMLLPIATWTSRSLQFQPPDTKPAGVWRQPLVSSTEPTTKTTTTTIHAAGPFLADRNMAPGITRGDGMDHGASHRWWARATTIVARMSSTTESSTATRSKPPTVATSSTRWADTYVLATTPIPTWAGAGSSGATRRTRTQPGTRKSHGQTSGTATIGIAQTRTTPTATAPISPMTCLVESGSIPERSSTGGCTEGR